MSQVVACPKCRKSYRVADEAIGRNMKCPACQTVFQARATTPSAAGAPQRKSAPPSAPATKAAPRDFARFGLDGPLAQTPQLFPPAVAQGPDPLANHVVDNPGFVAVDIEEIRRARLAAIARNRYAEAMKGGSALDALAEEDDVKKRAASKKRKGGYLTSDTLFGLVGRINRKKFWLSALFAGLLMSGGVLLAILFYTLILYSLDIDLPKRGQRNVSIWPMVPIFLIVIVTGVIGTWISIALHVKRYHDLGRPGSRFLLALIPLVGEIWVLVECGFQPGQPGTNAYGPDPLRK